MRGSMKQTNVNSIKLGVVFSSETGTMADWLAE